MIGKIIRMNRGRKFDLSGALGGEKVERLRDPVFALTRYIIDADPFDLVGQGVDDIVSLSEYALAVKKAGVTPGEKVEAFGAKNLVSEDLGLWQAQMLAVAASAKRVTSPLLHLILSLPEDEDWTAVERDQAIDIVLHTLKLGKCPVVWAQHSNTRNPHLHVAILRVDPVTQRAAGSNWIVDDLHQAIALVEERQGRRKEPNGLYFARDGAVFDAETNAMVRDQSGRYIPDWYESKGKKRTRLPVELLNRRAELITIASEAQNWAELHQLFAETGTKYDSVGSGARIAVGSASAKASTVHRSLARGALEERLGTFEPDIARIDSAHEAFRCQLDTQLLELRHGRDLACAGLKSWGQAMTSALRSDEKALVGRAIRTEVAEATKALRSAYKTSIKLCTDQRLSAEKWHAAGKPEYREVEIPIALYAGRNDGVEGRTDRSPSQNIRDLEWATDYLDDGGDLLFTDHRIIIFVHEPRNENAVDQALLLAAARWGEVSLLGPDSFLEFATARAACLGVKVANPDGLEHHALKEQPTGPAPSKAGSPAVDVKHEAKEREVDQIIQTLEKFETLVTRRRGEHSADPSGHNVGLLELHYRKGAHSSHKEGTMFDAHPRIQEFLEDKRAQTLLRAERAIEDAQLERVPTTAAEILEKVDWEPKLGRAIAAMASDQDLHDMLRLVRERMLEKQATRRNERNSTQGLGSTSFGIRNRTEDHTEYSLEQLKKYRDGSGVGGIG
ncbi:MAG TPA: hypothetical protein EYG46_08895 [Myxococcales bacterium]|nr:hypothetical protein [Myxococcales bacterium]